MKYLIRFSPAFAAFLLMLPLSVGAQTLANPLGTTDIRVIIGRVIQGLLGLSGSIALLMFLYGGILWMTSGGNTDRVDKGKRTLIWATIGLVVIFTSYTLVTVLIRALTGQGVT